MKRIVMGLLAATLSVSAAYAAELKPAVVYDFGGKFDKSFNEAAYNGAAKYKADHGTNYREFEIQNDAQREQALRKFAQDGNSPVVIAGFSAVSAIEKVSKEFPDTKFVIIDAVVEGPNVRSVVFKEEEGGYLVGLLAAMASKTGTVSFVGGMDVPLIRRFYCGYAIGAIEGKKGTKVLNNWTGDTPAAWNDPAKGSEIAKAQMDQGSDVIYHAAGGTGIGVLQAAADAGKLGIGVDSNQNGLHPGHVLTSMVKGVDTAVYKAFEDVAADKFTAGIVQMGLKDDGVSYAMDENNAKLITPEMKAAVEAAKADIISGKIKVHDYTTDNKCPY
ncbi:BMP family ABC transporter substrate-binding protein [Bacillus subtilis]|jgi:basic membrane protein A|uniref:BMP family lipoprotein n=1 Tax=Pseudochrobactrum asaccharolyticum TaxID=354351 RepID=UPI000EFCDC81|nr:BMP family ABC transporter substrate-binding protein [Pseudochrobactrum asaccharolyticum]MBX8802751.1 BMP family ABC transporter substrate-binding protein [Ochrobactrum sp. MR28]MBX8818274.1 BMP family ABC transporter substrate-binding protein [Ochrobactrum sp. MR31]MCF7673063.1 BMP family ABC transporter substrate-binding protein [Bacillus subtilis]MDR2311147.1 BMP family ABC transporter substrate-binding protein [Brucellaceae bacterium]MCF7647410.1 BMP family ABC transporter substrate-bin